MPDPARPGRYVELAVRSADGGPARVLTAPRLVRTTGDGVVLTLHLGRQPGPRFARATLRLELGVLPCRELLTALDARGPHRPAVASAAIRSAAIRSATYRLHTPEGHEVGRSTGLTATTTLGATVTGAAADQLSALALAPGAGALPGWRLHATVSTTAGRVELESTLDDLLAPALATAHERVVRLVGPYEQATPAASHERRRAG